MDKKLFLAVADFNVITPTGSGDSKSVVVAKTQKLVWAATEEDAKAIFEQHIIDVAKSDGDEVKIIKIQATEALE